MANEQTESQPSRTPQEHTTTVITDMKTRSNPLTRPLVAVLLGSHALGVKATYQYFAGYEPLSNVTHHSMIDLDLKDIMAGLGDNCGEDLNDCSATPACPGNACRYSADDMSFPTDEAQCAFTVANYAKTNAPACSNSYDIWMDGKNSLKSTAVRSISKFASGAESKGSDAAIPYKDNAFIKVMNEYWESKGLDKYTWGFDMIKAAFDGTQIGQLNFGTVGRTFRKEAIQKGLLYLNVYPYAIWEMQDQINDCRIDGTNEDPSVKAWDEAVAFWAGSLTRGRAYGQTDDKEGEEDNFIYALGDKRCANFGTCATGFSGTALVNQELLALFNRGKEQARSLECEPIDDIHEKIGTLMMVPFIQGTLRYLYYTKDAQDAKSTGELWAFATAILPFVNEVNPAAAEALYKRAWLLDFSGSYEADKKLLEDTYSNFGVGAGKGSITCETIGDLYSDPMNMLSENTCSSSSPSKDDDGLALKLGLGLGAACVVCLGLTAMSYSKGRKTNKQDQQAGVR